MPVLAGLIEMQTTGRVTSVMASDRLPTRTDAALLAPLIDDCMARFEGNIAGQPDATGFSGYRYGVMVENTRMLGMALTAVDFHSFRLSVDLCDGAKTGEFMLMLPRIETPAKANGGTKEETVTGRSLGEAMMGVPAQIEAVLCRLKLPLSQVREMKVGDQLPLPRDVLAAIALEAGQKIRLADTRLGQLNGYRAVRLFGLNMDDPSGEGASGGSRGQAMESDQLRKSAGIPKNGATQESGQKPVKPVEQVATKPGATDAGGKTTEGQGETKTPKAPADFGNT
jgi:flagellar motor switch protein FliM